MPEKSDLKSFLETDITDSVEDLKKRREEGNFSPSQGEAWEVDNITFPNTSTMVPFDVETEDVEVDTQVAIPQMEPGSQFRVEILADFSLFRQIFADFRQIRLEKVRF